MTFRLPDALDTRDDAAALDLLRRYFGTPLLGPQAYGGAHFDTWDSRGTGPADRDVFTADDLVAVTFLSVTVSAEAARALLRDRRQEFATLLVELGPDRDLSDVSETIADDWSGWKLMRALRSLPDVGPTTATKLLARKRPRLRPIWDSVVTELTGTFESQWEPLRVALRLDDAALHRRLVALHEATGLPTQVSALRVFDVICWMEGKDKGLGTRRG